MEANFLREYKGFKIYELGPFDGMDIMERRIDVETPDGKPGFSNFMNVTDPAVINKKIEIAKEWIDYKIQNPDQRMCRVCGCTEENCSQCVEKTGSPCYWVDTELCSACVDVVGALSTQLKNNQSSNNSNQMEFFSKLAAQGNIDITLRIMQKNDKLTMEVNPGSNKAAGVKPSLITGTGAELDEQFFETVFPAIKEIDGIVSNLKDVKIQAQQKADKKRVSEDKPKKGDSKKQPPKKVAKKEKKADSKEPEVQEDEPSLFDEPTVTE